jgi:hypothetical protein
MEKMMFYYFIPGFILFSNKESSPDIIPNLHYNLCFYPLTDGACNLRTLIEQKFCHLDEWGKNLLK